MEEKQVHIPEGWKIRDFGKLITEKRKSPSKVSDAANFGEFPFFTSGDAVLQHTTKQLDGKNIFLATGGVANIKYYEGAASYSTDTYVVTGREEIETEYLYFDLLNILCYINANYFQGSGLKHLQKKDLKNHQIIFPGNPREQLKIVDILSKADEAISQTEQLIAKYTRIKTGLMQDLLTKGIDEQGNIRSEETHEFKDSLLGRIPKEWGVENLGDIVNSGNGTIQTGPFGSQLHANEYVIEGIAVIMPQDIKPDGLDYSNVVRISKKKANSLKRHIVQENDIIFARRGDLSKCTFIGSLFRGSICGTGCLLIRLNKTALSPYWLELIYKHYLSQKEIDISAVGSTMKNLNTTILSNLPIPKVSISEQLRIIDYLRKIQKTLNEYNLQLAKSQSIKTGLMQDLLSGKVRVNHMIESVKTKEKMA